MIKITNGSRTTTVTKGVFKELYEPMGWKIADISEETPQNEGLPEVEIKEPEESSEPAEETPEEVEPEEGEDVEVEIPISEMKLAELKQYAEDHGIDISAAKNKNDIKAIIRAEMEG